MASRRKVTFLWLDSIRVIFVSGDEIFMGRPGKPAPEPRSTARGAGGDGVGIASEDAERGSR
jgi:hypothetical protein